MKKSTGIFICIIVGLILIIAEISAKKLITDNKENDMSINYKELLDNKQKQEINIKNENIVFLGDSITEIYPIDDIYSDLPVVRSGKSGYKTENILNEIDSMLYQYNPTKVILLIGTNDISHDISDEKLEETIKNIKKISKKIKENRKYAKIYIESIYPINRNMDKGMVADRTNEAIKKINEEIKQYCEENDITYIDMYNELTDENGNFDEKYTYDGLHPNTLGYAKITRVLMPYIFEGYDIK